MTATDKYINNAIAAAERFLNVSDNNISKEYKSDISSMGAAMINAGVLTTLRFYEIAPSPGQDDDENAHARRNHVSKALCYILTQGGEDSFLSAWYNTRTDKRRAATQIMNAAIALKLAIRCYNQV
jgi:CRISPR-associated protein (Cas_Cmr5)